MFDHIGIRVSDLAASVRIYRAMLEPLGFVLDDSGTGFGPKGEPALWLVATSEPSGAHVALKAPNRKAVDAFHQAALAAGAKDNGAPGLRADYSPKYYAAFVIDRLRTPFGSAARPGRAGTCDRDGNNIEAVTFTG